MTSDATSVYLSDGKTVLRFPVCPQSVTVSFGNNIARFSIAQSGDIGKLLTQKLISVSFSAHIPLSYSYICTCPRDEFQPPEVWISTLSRWQEERVTPRLVFCSAKRTLNLPVIITDATVTEHGGFPGDIFLWLSLCEYRAASPRLTGSVGAKRAATQLPAEYVARDGDDLFTVSRRSYGTDSWRSLLSANSQLGNSFELARGTVIRLP